MRHKFLPIFDLALVQLSFFICAWLLRVEFNPTTAPLVYAITMSFFAYVVGMYGIAVRYAGVALLKSAAVGAACGFTALAGVYGLDLVGYFAFSSLVSVCAVICSRVIVREYLFQSRHEKASNTLVYGAGDAGIQFVTAAMQGDKFNVLGYIDDDNKRVGSSIHGRLVSPSKDLYDLAKRLIRLSGKELCEIGQGVGSGCVEIKVTGLRPGEKLYEELLIDSSALPTEHEKICRAVEPLQPLAKLANALDGIKDALKKGDIGRAKNLLVEIGTGYQQT